MNHPYRKFIDHDMTQNTTPILLPYQTHPSTQAPSKSIHKADKENQEQILDPDFTFVVLHSECPRLPILKTVSKNASQHIWLAVRR